MYFKSPDPIDTLYIYTGPRLNIKNVFRWVVIPVIKIRRSLDRLIFIMESIYRQDSIFRLRQVMSNCTAFISNGSTSVLSPVDPNHQPHDCLINCLFRRRSNKTLNLRVTGSVMGIHRWPVNSPHKGSVMRKMFPFDDVIITSSV